MGTGETWGPASLTLKCRPAAERSLSRASIKFTREERSGERGKKTSSDAIGAGGRLSGRFCHSAPYTCSESVDFKRLVNIWELAQPHYIACLFGIKYLCKYRSRFSPSFGTKRYWKFRRSFSTSVSVIMHSENGIAKMVRVFVAWC